ncbi:MAG: zinc ABC transporter substrate-binding protein [Micavibrio aeruginosavorus]|uniref:Zinc ABC transporter substrate-binding protein n=1 Tax=Micavibrio aeruginosavorus TaxID=349221 RepID=A0A7T5UHN2_9BACT|nr:MAG: zinc ABC transporter substrate-binding protein [Micavibrio aeruginosavorus]
MRYSILAFFFLVAFPVQAQAKVNIFACEPEWGALAQEIGGEAVDVYTASTAAQNVHFLRAKPGLLSAMRQADLVFCNGAALEAGWLPVLLQKAGGPDVQPGKPGHLLAADHVKKLDVPARIDRSMGDVHPDGNPHILLNPRNIGIIAEALADRLKTIDAANRQNYDNRLNSFLRRWKPLTDEWERLGASLRGMKVVVYHTNWAYLINWLALESTATLEPKPGIPPTASHLKAVLTAVEGHDVKAILVAPFENPEAAEWLAGKSGIPVIRLPYTVGGSDKAGDLEGLFSETIRLLREASP